MNFISVLAPAIVLNFLFQMAFQRFALFFKQDFTGGYRYLDRCGEFLVTAEREMNLLPTEEISPSGGKMENPEIGIKAEFNTSFLRVVHEMPEENDTTQFTKHVEYLSDLYKRLFEPSATERIGVAVNVFTSFNEVSQAESASLKWGDSYQEEMAQAIGMPSNSKTTEYMFSAGSRMLRAKIHPATFEKIQIAKRNVGSRGTAQQKEIARRQNLGAERASHLELSHALFVDLDLTEDKPPEGAFIELLEDLKAKEVSVLNKLFS